MLAKVKRTTAPVSVRALLGRINRKLAADGEMLKAARSAGVAESIGSYFVVRGNAITRQDVDLEELGRESGLFARMGACVVMNFTFWQRWRGNVMLVAIVIGFLLWNNSLPRHDGMTPEQVHAFTVFLIGLCGAWLVISAVWCFISQLQFEQKMREIRRFQHRVASGEFDRRGPLGGPWDARR